MCVAVGIGWNEALELDGDAYDALELAVAERWTPELELAAIIAELESAQLSAFVQVHTKKGGKVPPILRVPRPGSSTPSTSSSSSADEASVPGRVTPSTFARLFGGRRVEGV